MTSFGESIYTIKINIKEAEMDQTNLSENMVNFNTESRPKTKEAKDKKWNTFDSVSALYEGRQLTVNAFTRGIFPIKKKKRKKERKGHPLDLATWLKILNPKQVLQRLPISLAQLKADNTSQNLLNEIRQIIYSLYRAKETTAIYMYI